MKIRHFVSLLLLVCILSSCNVISVDNTEFSQLLQIQQAGNSTIAKDLLDEQMRQNYEWIEQGIYSLQTNINLKHLSQDKLKKLVEFYKADNPQVFWLASDYGYDYNVFTKDVSNIRFSYDYRDATTGQEITYTKHMVEEMNLMVETQARLILNGISSDMSEYQKVQYLHDYLAKSITYDESGSFAHNIYGALVEKRAVCDGYAFAFQYLLTQIGMESRIVYGISLENVPHAWNVVKIDGNYYHIDVTWDSPLDGASEIVYTNFNLTDQQVMENRIIHSPFIGEPSGEYDCFVPIPHCENTDYYYYHYHGLYIDQLNDDTIQYIVDLLSQTVERRDTSIQLKFASQQMVDEFMQMVDDGVHTAFRKFPYSTATMSTSIITNGDSGLMIFQVEYLDDLTD